MERLLPARMPRLLSLDHFTMLHVVLLGQHRRTLRQRKGVALTHRWDVRPVAQDLEPEPGHGDRITDPDGSALVDQVDAALGDQNSEYQTKRKSLRYGAPIIRVVRPGEFDRYRRRMVEQGHRTDGQFKVLRITSDISFAAEFQADRDLVGGEVPKPVTEQFTPAQE